jgi:hypothetical protein
MADRSGGHGKPGWEISNEVIPCAVAHSPSATSFGSAGAILPCRMPRSTFSMRLMKADSSISPGSASLPPSPGSHRPMNSTRYPSALESPKSM